MITSIRDMKNAYAILYGITKEDLLKLVDLYSREEGDVHRIVANAETANMIPVKELPVWARVPLVIDDGVPEKIFFIE